MQQGIYVNKVETLVFIAKTFVVVVVVVVVVVNAVAFAAVGVVGYTFEATHILRLLDRTFAPLISSPPHHLALAPGLSSSRS
jgi:hypothetical protein